MSRRKQRFALCKQFQMDLRKTAWKGSLIESRHCNRNKHLIMGQALFACTLPSPLVRWEGQASASPAEGKAASVYVLVPQVGGSFWGCRQMKCFGLSFIPPCTESAQASVQSFSYYLLLLHLVPGNQVWKSLPSSFWELWIELSQRGSIAGPGNVK